MSLQLDKITVAQIVPFNFTIPFNQLPQLAAQIRSVNHPLATKIDSSMIDSLIQNIILIRDTPGTSVRYCYRYMQISSGVSVLGAVGIVARINDVGAGTSVADVSITVRCVEARHNTPTMYRSWVESEGRHHPRGGGVHDVTRYAPRGLDENEIKQIRDALVLAIAPMQAMLTAN